MGVLEATTETFEEQLKAAEYVVVDFYGDHCGGCVYLEPFYKEAAIDMPYIHFVKINISHNKEIGQRYSIEGMPTLKFFHNGQEIHKIESGRIDRKELNSNIAKLLYAGF